MDKQMYKDKSSRVKWSIRVRPFIGNEVGIDECISIPNYDTIQVSDFSKSVEK